MGFIGFLICVHLGKSVSKISRLFRIYYFDFLALDELGGFGYHFRREGIGLKHFRLPQTETFRKGAHYGCRLDP